MSITAHRLKNSIIFVHYSEIDKMKEVKGGVNDNVYFYGSAGGSVRDTMIDGRVSIDNCC